MLRTAMGRTVTLTCHLLFGMIGLAFAPISSTNAGENYALLVGVGDYDPKQLNKLTLTRNGVIELRDVLLKSGFKLKNVALMRDDPKGVLPARMLPESSKIRNQLSLILAGRGEDDTVILAFTGQVRGSERRSRQTEMLHSA